MGRNVVRVVGIDAGGWVEINYDLIGSRCRRLWLCHLFAVPKFSLLMRKMTENIELGKATGASNRVLQPGLFCGAPIHILRNSPECNPGIGRVENSFSTPFLLSRHSR